MYLLLLNLLFSAILLPIFLLPSVAFPRIILARGHRLPLEKRRELGGKRVGVDIVKLPRQGAVKRVRNRFGRTAGRITEVRRCPLAEQHQCRHGHSPGPLAPKRVVLRDCAVIEERMCHHLQVRPLRRLTHPFDGLVWKPDTGEERCDRVASTTGPNHLVSLSQRGPPGAIAGGERRLPEDKFGDTGPSRGRLHRKHRTRGEPVNRDRPSCIRNQRLEVLNLALYRIGRGIATATASPTIEPINREEWLQEAGALHARRGTNGPPVPTTSPKE